jgi:hypothetical protein
MAGQPVRRAREGRPPAPGASGTSARGYSWPPLQHGHELSTRHGAWSARRVDPITKELIAALIADRPDLARYPETLMAWGRAEARCILLGEWQAEHGLMDDDGKVRGGEWVGTFERLAMNLRERIGLDPRSEAELAHDRADAERSVVDLDALRERGRVLLDARDIPKRSERDARDEREQDS